MSEIVRRVPCEWERVKMAFACRSGRGGLAAPPPPPPALPQLLVPSDDLTRVHLILSDHSTHHQKKYHDVVGGRYFGSYHGGFLLVASDQSRRHRLVDLQREKVRLLPDALCVCPFNQSAKQVHSMALLAVTFSSPTDDPACVAAGIVTYPLDGDNSRQRRRCAFWRMGDRVAYETLPPLRGDVEDVVHHDNFFAFLTDEEHILVCWPAFYPDVEDDLRRGVFVEATLRCHELRDRTNEGSIRARYLLESRGNLLMVIRFAPDRDSPTSGFKVFSTSGPHPPAEGSFPWYEYKWSELGTLGGRMLFLGRGCSRSYETAEYPGFEDGIYFLDDPSFYDEHIMFRGVGERQYPCSDNGKWTQGPPPNVKLFFPDQVTSNHSSPAWLLI